MSQTPRPSNNGSLWYGMCGYWTTDWSKLRSVGPGIPACPWCRAPGFITTEKEWWEKVAAYEENDADGLNHPGYKAEIEAKREKCPHQQEIINRTRHG